MIYKDPEAICLRNSKVALTNVIGQTVLDLLINVLINKLITTGPTEIECHFSVSQTICLTLLSDQGTFTPVGAQGGSMEPPLKKTTFPPEFCNEICTIYVWTI